jgi:uncharacterized membrane protein SpoIIM required for sporulation
MGWHNNFLIIFLCALVGLAFCIHRLVMSAVEGYEYGSGGTFKEWKDFERQHGYGR